MTTGMPSSEPTQPSTPSGTKTPVAYAAAPINEIGARALWTLAEAAIAALVAWAVGVAPDDEPFWFAAITTVGAAVLSAIKSFIATKVGNPDTVTFDK